MKVAILTETFLPQINGVVRTVERIVRHLEAHGHEALLIAIGDQNKESWESYSKTRLLKMPGVKFHLYQELNLAKPEEQWIANLLDMKVFQLPIASIQSLVPTPHSLVGDALQEFKPDIIHLVTPVTLGSIGFYYVGKMKLPCLSTFHTDLAAYAPRYNIPYGEEIINTATKLIYNRTDRVLAPSPSSQKQLEKIGVDNVGVFGRGVNNELFNPKHKDKNLLTDYGLDPKKITIMYGGRLAEEKSIPELVQAFKLLSEDHKNIQLLLVGDGPIRKELEKKLKGTNHAFTGFKTGEDYAKLHACADIFAFPSKTETFGQVVLEAMASGSPVVGFDSPGVRDLVIHEETGLLAPVMNELSTMFDSLNANVEGLRSNLEELIKDKSLRERMSENSFKEAQKRSWDEIIGGLVKEYEELIKAH